MYKYKQNKLHISDYKFKSKGSPEKPGLKKGIIIVAAAVAVLLVIFIIGYLVSRKPPETVNDPVIEADDIITAMQDLKSSDPDAFDEIIKALDIEQAANEQPQLVLNPNEVIGVLQTIKYYSNGELIDNPYKSIFYNDFIYTPIGRVVAALGKDVNWDNETRSVYISDSVAEEGDEPGDTDEAGNEVVQ